MTAQFHRDIAAAHTAEAERLENYEPVPPDIPDIPDPPDTGNGGGTDPNAGDFPDNYDDFGEVDWDFHSEPVYPQEPNELLENLEVDTNSGEPTVFDSQNGYNGYRIETFRMKCREGPRAAGGPIALHNGYIEVHSEADDHSDGVQGYQGSDMSMSATKILAGGGGAAGVFSADGTSGLWEFDGVYFGALPGHDKPGFLLRINEDGADEVKVRNAIFQRGAAHHADISISARITEWENNTWDDGEAIPQQAELLSAPDTPEIRTWLKKHMAKRKWMSKK